MKRLIIALLFSTSLGLQAQDRESIKLGLIQHLVRIKSDAECKMLELMNCQKYLDIDTGDVAKIFREEHKHAKEKDIVVMYNALHADVIAFRNEMNGAYNLVLKDVDGFILQLTADLQEKNRLRFLRRIDKYYKGSETVPKKCKVYLAQLNLIDTNLQKLQAKQCSPHHAPFDGIWDGSAPTDFGTLATSVITSARDFRATKIGNLTTLLNGLRLSSVSALASGGSSGSPSK